MKALLALARPRFQLPKALPKTFPDFMALGIGTGLGIGFLTPASATWGSLLGLVYLMAWAGLPGLVIPVLVQSSMLALSAWAAGRCERLLGVKDPHPVVIDEIVALPFAFWPLLRIHEQRPLSWIAAYCLYRVADVIKPWPARKAERIPGGIGIVADDIISASYTGLVLFAFELLATRLS